MRQFHFIMFMGLVAALCSAVAFAQEKAPDKKMDMPGGVRSSFLKQSKFVEGQLTSLAQAVPQEKYSWRPAEGVRSVSESFMHAALGNYVCLMTMGGKVPEGIDMNTFEKSTTDKAKVVEALKKSFASVNDFVGKIPDGDFDKHVNFFGNDMTILDMVFGTATHQHEVLGQSIAYARTNNVTPPWTAEMQAREKANAPAKK